MVGLLSVGAIILASVLLVGAIAGHRPVVIETGSMNPYAPAGSVAIAGPRNGETIRVDDVIVMRRPGQVPVTHRVVELDDTPNGTVAQTQGDANATRDPGLYPLGSQELVVRWVLPEPISFVTRQLLHPVATFAFVLVSVLVLSAYALRRIWSVSDAGPKPRAEHDRTSHPRVSRRRKRRVIGGIPLISLLGAGVAWSVFLGTVTVSTNTFATAGCFDSSVRSVQQGTTAHTTDGTVTVPIAPVDPTTSFVFATAASETNVLADALVLVELAADGTTVDLTRTTDSTTAIDLDIAWNVVEYTCGVTVTRGVTNGDGSTTPDIAFDPADADRAIVLLSTDAPRNDTVTDGNEFIAHRFDGSDLRVAASGPVPSAQRIGWQVIVFDDPFDVAVQRTTVQVPAGDDSSAWAPPSPVDPDTTLILTSTLPQNFANGSDALVRTNLDATGSVQLDRVGTGAPIDVDVQLIQFFDGTTVQHGITDLPAGVTDVFVNVTPVDPQRSTAMTTAAVGGTASSGQTSQSNLADSSGDAAVRATVTAPTEAQLRRDGAGQDSSFGWQVAEWGGAPSWDADWPFRQRIDVETTSTPAPDGYTVPVEIDHRALVDAGLANADGSDLRIVGWDGSAWIEFDRVLDEGSAFNSSTTTLLFRTDRAVPASGRISYYLHFGNPTAGPAPSDPENVFAVFESFDDGSLGDFENRGGPIEWYVADPWTRRIPITVPSGRVQTSQSDVPLIVSLTNTDLAAHAQADGSDIRFVAADGTTHLAHEIERWDPATGALDAWVHIPTIASTAPTSFFVEYGAPNAPSQEQIRATWPTDHDAVLHLRNADGNTHDSSVFGHDGSQPDVARRPTDAGGLIGPALRFDGIDDALIVAPTDWRSHTQLTASMWVRPDNLAGDQTLLRADDLAGSPVVHVAATTGGGIEASLRLNGTMHTAIAPAGSLSVGAWDLVVATWDSSQLRINVGVDEVASTPAIGIIDATSGPTVIGNDPTVSQPFAGIIDEVRIERTPRSSAWLDMRETSERNPQAFTTTAAPQAGTWGDQGTWSARIPLAVPADRDDGTAADQLVPIRIVRSELTGALTSGHDLIVTDGDGITRLDHWIESWDPTTGTLTAWIRTGDLDLVDDTVLYLYFGNGSARDQQDPAGTFGTTGLLAYLGRSLPG